VKEDHAMSPSTVHLVLSAIGTDRPGLVDALSQFLLDAGGNIEASRMSVLGGEFGVLVLVSASEESARRIEQGIDAFTERTGLRALVKRGGATSARAAGEALAYQLTATSLDQPGIVNRVSHLLASLGVNIESAECTARPGPWSGAPVFHLEMTLAVPQASEVAGLREALTQLGAHEGIDIELRAVKM
jgi:glycine cleavage system transcriptional repressor